MLFIERKIFNTSIRNLFHPAARCRGDVVATSLCTFQRRHRYVSNETTNDFSVERRQDVSVVSLHDVLLECHDDDVPSVRLHHVSELGCCDGLYVFKLLCHELNLVGFHVSFKYQIKHQIFSVPTRRETIRVFGLKISRTFITFKNGYIHQQYL